MGRVDGDRGSEGGAAADLPHDPGHLIGGRVDLVVNT